MIIKHVTFRSLLGSLVSPEVVPPTRVVRVADSVCRAGALQDVVGGLAPAQLDIIGI